MKILDDNNAIDENTYIDSIGDMSSITTAYENNLLNKQYLPYDGMKVMSTIFTIQLKIEMIMALHF